MTNVSPHRSGPVAFLFLGETLLIPHLWPIAEALAREGDVAVDLWVATSVHEELLTRWLAGLGSAGLGSAGLGDHVRIRRAPGYRMLPDLAPGENPPLPAKLPLLARLVPKLWNTPVAVCAEQTSLWLPLALPFHPTRFIDTFHGAGSMRAKGHWRRRAAWRTLVSSDRERDALIAMGDDAGRVGVTGYVKASFRQRSAPARLFDNDRPTVLYNPHWQRHRSSWWGWGPQVVRALAADPSVNLIFAPHQRLVEGAEDVAIVSAEVADLPNVHCDLASFAMVDGSYTAAADIYLGDTSSQVVEFLVRPRPCVFLNHDDRPWVGDASYDLWRCGEVVTALDRLPAALAVAPALQPDYLLEQQKCVVESLGDTSGVAPAAAISHIREALALGVRNRR